MTRSPRSSPPRKLQDFSPVKRKRTGEYGRRPGGGASEASQETTVCPLRSSGPRPLGPDGPLPHSADRSVGEKSKTEAGSAHGPLPTPAERPGPTECGPGCRWLLRVWRPADIRPSRRPAPGAGGRTATTTAPSRRRPRSTRPESTNPRTSATPSGSQEWAAGSCSSFGRGFVRNLRRSWARDREGRPWNRRPLVPAPAGAYRIRLQHPEPADLRHRANRQGRM